MRAVELRVERNGQEPAFGRARHQHFTDGDRGLPVQRAMTHEPDATLLLGDENAAVGGEGDRRRCFELIRERVEPELGAVDGRQRPAGERRGGAGDEGRARGRAGDGHAQGGRPATLGDRRAVGRKRGELKRWAPGVIGGMRLLHAAARPPDRCTRRPRARRASRQRRRHSERSRARSRRRGLVPAETFVAGNTLP